MIGCIAIGLAALGLVGAKLHHRRHCGRGFHGGGCHGRGRHGWHGRDGYYQDYGDHGWHGGPWRMMAALGTTPAQEKVIREEFGRLRDRARVAREEATLARGDLAEVLRADAFDKARFDTALGRVDAAWAQLKTSAAESIARVHETLDARQRERLADFLSQRRGGPSYGPFR
jgi:uncharacterized membrane protein